MARFYGGVRGNRGEATRMGGEGFNAYAAGWQGKVSVRLWRKGDVDMARVILGPHMGGGRQTTRVLYDGPLDPQAMRRANAAAKKRIVA
jgi:hypothetical protein